MRTVVRLLDLLCGDRPEDLFLHYLLWLGKSFRTCLNLCGLVHHACRVSAIPCSRDVGVVCTPGQVSTESDDARNRQLVLAADALVAPASADGVNNVERGPTVGLTELSTSLEGSL